MHNLLEKKIKEHAEELFGNEPLQGHRERFAGKLPVADKKRIPGDGHSYMGHDKQGSMRLSIYKIISWVSVAAVFAGCVFFLHHKNNSGRSESLSEVQNYYSMLLQDKIEDVEQLLQKVDEQDRDFLMKDMENMCEEADLAIRYSDEKNAAFVVQTYSYQIEAVQHIHNMLTNNL